MSTLGKVGPLGRWLGAAVLAAALVVSPVFAQDGAKKEEPKKEEPKKEDPKGASTITDPAVDIGDLRLMLEPLTRAELEGEANGWWKLLQGKVREVSEAELAVRRRNREIVALDKVKAAADNVAAAAVRAERQPATAATDAEKAAAAKLERAKAELEKASTAPKPEAASGDKPAGDAPAAPSDQALLERAVQSAAKQAARTGDDKQVTERADAAARETQATQAVASAAQVSVDGQAPTEAASGAGAAQKAENIAASVQEASAAKAEVKVQLIDFATQLGNERTQITDRLKIVIEEWDRKGGESKDIRQYIAAVGGLKVDVTDAASSLTRIKAWMMTDEGGLRMARNFALFMAYLAASFVLAWIIRSLVGRMLARMRHGPSQLLQKFVRDMSGRLVIFFGILAGLSALEINLSPLLAIIGASGFVVAFALQGTLSNFASGLLIMINKPFDVGDNVGVGDGIHGKVEELNIFSTLIRTPEGLSKIVPNNTIWNGVIVNETTCIVTPQTSAAA